MMSIRQRKLWFIFYILVSKEILDVHAVLRTPQDESTSSSANVRKKSSSDVASDVKGLAVDRDVGVLHSAAAINGEGKIVTEAATEDDIEISRGEGKSDGIGASGTTPVSNAALSSQSDLKQANVEKSENLQAIDTTLQNNVLLRQTIAANRSDAFFVIGVNIAQAAGGSANLNTRKVEAETMISAMIAAANNRFNVWLPMANAYSGRAEMVVAGGGYTVYVFIDAYSFMSSWQSNQRALESALVSDFQGLSGWNNGAPYLVTLGASGTTPVSNAALR